MTDPTRTDKIRVLFVCLGNICRSPLAEGALRAEAARLGLDLVVDSAGTGNWHAGEPPDERAQRTALRNGVDVRVEAPATRMVWLPRSPGASKT
mgnify:CR=1 FL=1